MSLLLVGVSHKSAPLTVLDRAALSPRAVQSLLADIATSPFVAEAMVLSTCNRVEVTAEVARFHGAVADITERMAKHCGLHLDELTGHLYVHFEERAVHHQFTVTSGLDSMIVGEQQILGQVRHALRAAQEAGTAGKSLNDLGQSALRVGKRVHTDTGVDRHGASIVSVALAEAATVLGSLRRRRALVIGAGAMSSLSAQTLVRSGVADLTITSRTPAKAIRLAESVPLEHDMTVRTRAVDLADLPEAIAHADVVVSCTGASGLVVSAQTVTSRLAERRGRPLVIVDLALPHDTDPAIGELPEVTRIDLASLALAPGAQAPASELDIAREIVDDEVRGYLAGQAADRVEPIVVSLRAKADVAVETELRKLRLRLPRLDDEAAAEVERALRRTVSTLLHTPTIRMKQFAADPGGQRYAEALHALFDLDPDAVQSLSLPEPAAGGESGPA